MYNTLAPHPTGYSLLRGGQGSNIKKAVLRNYSVSHNRLTQYNTV